MPEMHLREPGFIYGAYETFNKNKKRIQRFRKTGNLTYIYQNELDKSCFQHGLCRFLKFK